MKIAVNARFLQEKYYTGIQNYLENLYREISQLDKQNKYLFLKNDFGSKPWQKIAFDYFIVRRRLGKFKANIFHSPHSTLPLGPKNCFYIATIHDLGFKTLPQFAQKSDLLYSDWAIKNTIKRADLLVADSFFIKEEIKKYYHGQDSKIKVVSLGVDNFYLKKESRQYLKKIKNRYQCLDRKIILTNSAHSNRKNIDALVKIFNDNPSSLKGTCLLICGNIGQTGFQKTIKSRRILLAGYVSKREMRALYQSADLFIYPSLYEGFGLPVLEAMACRCLITASDIPPIKEIFNNQDFLFDPLNVKEICEKIEELTRVRSSAKRIIVDSYQKILNRFRWQNSAQEMIKIFNSL